MTRRAWAVLLAAVVAAAFVLAGVHALTRGYVDVGAAQRELLARVLPASSHDNDPLAEEVRLHAPRWLGSDAPRRAWRARRGGRPAALVLEAVVPDGYAGPVHLLVAVDSSGALLGVHVLRHRETPGLGDAIEPHRGGWLARFTGRSLDDPPSSQWAVQRDGGGFDQIAGATITSRAVVGTLRRVLQYVARHGAAIEAAPAGSTLEHPDAPDA